MTASLKLHATVLALPLLLLAAPVALADASATAVCERYSRGEEPPFASCGELKPTPVDDVHAPAAFGSNATLWRWVLTGAFSADDLQDQLAANCDGFSLADLAAIQERVQLLSGKLAASP